MDGPISTVNCNRCGLWVMIHSVESSSHRLRMNLGWTNWRTGRFPVQLAEPSGLVL